MKKKSTGDLRQELMDQPNLDAYIHENQAYFLEKNVTELLAQMYGR